MIMVRVNYKFLYSYRKQQNMTLIVEQTEMIIILPYHTSLKQQKDIVAFKSITIFHISTI